MLCWLIAIFIYTQPELLDEYKLKLFLYMSWRYMGGIDIQLHTFLTTDSDTGEWSPSWAGRFSPQGKSPRDPLDMNLGGSHSRCQHFEKERINLFSLPEIDIWFLDGHARSLGTIPTELLRP